jgi:two-component system response regulator AtoC
MSQIKILVVDDEKLIRWSVEKELQKLGYQVLSAENGKIAWKLYCEEAPAVVLVDYKMPGFSGIEMLQQIREKEEITPVIIMTAHGGVETAVTAMKLGAFDYITKPFNLDELLMVVQKALEVYHLRQKLESSTLKERSEWGIKSMVGNSKSIQEIKHVIEKVANTNAATVLIQGESGTGKELVARALHFESRRASEPFIAVNCSAIPETLIESELFGHEKGAFTDAVNLRKGYFESADGGTIFLDEISEMNMNLQVKLLRAIEEKSIRRVGGSEDVKVDVRIVAATNKELEKLVEQNQFRNDLFYRISVITVYVPSLRSRGDDIIQLCRFFMNKYSLDFKKHFSGITEEAENILLKYSWPGNIRELKNLIERIVLLYSDLEIKQEHLQGLAKKGETQKYQFLNGLEIPEEGIDIEKVEETLIRKTLEVTKNNQSKAARLLNLTRDTLRYRMKKFGIENGQEN